MLLKLCSSYMYHKVKYLDDGRDLVSAPDFVSIHVAVSIMNSWMTYICIYTSAINFARLCPYSFLSADTKRYHWYCPQYSSEEESLPLQQYYYNMFMTYSEFFIIVILCEVFYVLAYYKDIVFSSCFLCFFVGMLITNYQQIEV